MYRGDYRTTNLLSDVSVHGIGGGGWSGGTSVQSFLQISTQKYKKELERYKRARQQIKFNMSVRVDLMQASPRHPCRV